MAEIRWLYADKMESVNCDARSPRIDESAVGILELQFAASSMPDAFYRV